MKISLFIFTKSKINRKKEKLNHLIMPTIPKLRDFNKKYMKSHAREPKRDNLNNKQQKYLTNRRYREFRVQCLMKHPVCELSLLEDKIVEAKHTHHLLKYYD